MPYPVRSQHGPGWRSSLGHGVVANDNRRLRLATTTDALTGVVTNGYNTNDDMTSLKDPRNNVTTYTYNAFGDVTAESSPDRGATSYVVNKAGDVTQKTDARSVVTNYTYDALNRLKTVTYPSQTALNVTLTYDTATNCGTAYKGKLCSVSDAAGTIAYQWDVLGRMTQEKSTRGSNNLIIQYGYDLAGNLNALTLPSGRTVSYTISTNGRVTGVSATVAGVNTTLASSGTYLPFGPMTGLTYGNSKVLTAAFDTDYNPTSRAVSGLFTATYATDANGNVTQAGTTTYGFDQLNRVNAENAGTATSYTYDLTDNRLTKVAGSTTTTTVLATNNKISAVGAASYSYDLAGNITGDGTNTYTWNAAGQLETVKVGATTVGTYTYDYLGRRAKKVAGGSTTYYVYGPNGEVYGEYTGGGALRRETLYLNGAPLAQITGSTDVLTYLHTDHLGTPRYGTAAGGGSVWAWTNDAFGTSTPTGSRTVDLRMAGQLYDSESGLFYNWNRYYNPAIGRYISPDPIGQEGGLNLFDYVFQNPVMGVDPAGLMGPSTLEILSLCGRNPSCAAGLISTTYTVYQWCEKQINANETSEEDQGDENIARPNTGNPELDNVLEGSRPGDSDKGWWTPGTKEGLEAKIKAIPGAIQKPTPVGGTTTTLPDGTKVDTYPERSSTKGPGWSVTKPGSKDGDGGKGTIIDE